MAYRVSCEAFGAVGDLRTAEGSGAAGAGWPRARYVARAAAALSLADGSGPLAVIRCTAVISTLILRCVLGPSLWRRNSWGSMSVVRPTRHFVAVKQRL